MVRASSLPLAVSLLESLTRGLTCRTWSFHCYSPPAPREDLAHNSESAMPVERVNVGEIGDGAKVWGLPSTLWSCPSLRLGIILRTSCGSLEGSGPLLQATEDVLGSIPVKGCRILTTDGLDWARVDNAECTLYFKVWTPNHICKPPSPR